MLNPLVMGDRHYRIAREVCKNPATYEELKDIMAMLGIEELSEDDRRAAHWARLLERFRELGRHGQLETLQGKTGREPAFAMEPARLLSALVRQFLFETLCRAASESYAAENAARLAAMQAAERSIAERFEQLRNAYHQQRQNTVTEELMDVISGFEALARGETL